MTIRKRRAHIGAALLAACPAGKQLRAPTTVAKFVWPTPFGFFSFPRDWLGTLGKIKALGYKTLIPGHGEPQTNTRYIDQLIGSIEDIRAQVGPLAKRGLSREEVNKRVDFSRYARIFGTTERRKTLFKAYWTDPMTENAWKEAKGLPITQGEGEVTVDKQSQRRGHSRRRAGRSSGPHARRPLAAP